MPQADPSTELAALYLRAFAQFGARALWRSRPVASPTPQDALAIAWSLRVEGDLEALRLSERIEALCGAAH